MNPDERLTHKSFEDCLAEGPLAALEAIEAATGECEANILGYCSGGTLTACLLACLAAKGVNRVASATFLTTLTDFGEPGEIKVFIDDEQLTLLEAHMRRKGYLEARQMQQVFSLLRPNELIWSYVVNNYLMGREPPALDLLHWNADGTRMPCTMHSFYLRSMYQRNLLTRPGGMTLLGVPVDLSRIRTPCYFLSAREDHIAPWRSVYRGSRLLGGRRRFVLGEAGHIAGVVNPLPQASTATGPIRTGRPTPTPGCAVPRAEPARGGRTGPHGSGTAAAVWYLPGHPVAAVFRRSRMLRAGTSW